MNNSILRDTLLYLQTLPELSKRRIAELHLTRYFTVIETDDGSVGSCMSYYWLPDQTLSLVEQQIAKCLAHDPFAVCDGEAVNAALEQHITSEAQRYFVITSVMASIACALSAPLIARGGDDAFQMSKQRPADWLDGVETALVIGFGGYLSSLAAEERISKLHVIDLTYDQRRKNLDAQISIYREQFPGKTITVSTSLNGKQRLRDFDLISITGSTLSNGSLEGILSEAGDGPKMILQGQSAALYPRFLFRNGISWVATTLKTRALTELARGDYSGRPLKPLLEGELPWIYFVPRKQAA